jgi:hypothetical protein
MAELVKLERRTSALSWPRVSEVRIRRWGTSNVGHVVLCFSAAEGSVELKLDRRAIRQIEKVIDLLGQGWMTPAQTS